MYEEGNGEQAQWVQSGMILNVLGHATDSLDYLRLLRNQSVFNFCAIPQSMAIATLALCFMNPDMFQRNIKIRKAEAADVSPFFIYDFGWLEADVGGLQLIMRSTNPRDVAYIFREYARRIHTKAVPEDPSFIQIGVVCGKVSPPPLSSPFHHINNSNSHRLCIDRTMVRTLLPLLRPHSLLPTLLRPPRRPHQSSTPFRRA